MTKTFSQWLSPLLMQIVVNPVLKLMPCGKKKLILYASNCCREKKVIFCVCVFPPLSLDHAKHYLQPTQCGKTPPQGTKFPISPPITQITPYHFADHANHSLLDPPSFFWGPSRSFWCPPSSEWDLLSSRWGLSSSFRSPSCYLRAPFWGPPF